MFKRSRLPAALFVLISFCAHSEQLYPISISDKKALLEKSQAPGNLDGNVEVRSLESIGQKIKEKKKALIRLYIEANDLYQHKQPDSEALISMKGAAIKQERKELDILEKEWREASQEMLSKEEEALWHQPETNIGQLVIDYGGADCIYLMPPEIASLRVHVSSQLSIPKASWQEVLDLLLSTYGIGIKDLSPFLKQLYFLRLNQSGLALITDKREELDLLPRDSKAAFVFSPQPHEIRRTYQFLEKFIPQEQMTLQIIGGNLIAIGLTRELIELLKIYDFISSPKQAQEWRLIALQKAQSEEMAKILLALFTGDNSASSSMLAPPSHDVKMPYMPSHESGGAIFRVMALKYPGNSLFLMGKKEQLEKAEAIIKEIEGKIGEVQEKTIYWYACKHSDADELAKVLSQVYTKMAQITASDNKLGAQDRTFAKRTDESSLRTDKPAYTPDNAPLVVSPSPLIVTDHTKKKRDVIHENFIVDQKTNAIVMVVESYILPKLRELLRKLDVPKKMVQIDVLLFEKRVTDSDQFGLNLLKLADAVTDPHATKLFWNDTANGHIENKGILLYSLTRGKSHGFPKYSAAYQFLLSQSGIHINANPSVTTVNQTPAIIALVDEISINTGVVEVDTNTSTRLKDSYTRAQYGTTIQVTPTVHSKSENEEEPDEIKYITLETDITFDTTKPSPDSRPEVSRRNIKNEVRIADGETVIIGGLRRKQSQNDKDAIPFLGEIPGIGKLFSTTALTDSTTEMFIFITPKIIPDPKEEYHELRREELKKRPGDIPEFLKEVEKAQANERNRLFYHTMKILTEGN